MNAKKLLAAVLCLTMALTLLPAVAVVSNAAGVAPTGGILLFEDNFNDGNYDGWTQAGNKPSVKDGVVSFSVTGQSYLDQVLTTIPQGAKLCLEYGVATNGLASDCTYWIKLDPKKDGSTVRLTFDSSRSDTPNQNGLGNTNTTEIVTHYQYYTLDRQFDNVLLRVGQRGSGGTGSCKVDFVKVYLLEYTADQLKTELESADGYAKLSADATIEGSLTLGENAVLDLNGHSLTATIVSPGTNATIIDSSAAKNGKLIVPKDSLVNLKSNNPQLPLWAGNGYIFTEPQLGSERAFLAESSADGFKMDFRPGFGTTIRENYLSQGNTGIKMTADLSWTDIYGYEGSYAGGLNGTKIFNEMYQTETARGRLQITGAEKYRNISLALTLESCGVKVSFDPIVFNNTYVTTHFAADFDAQGETTLTTTYATPNGVNEGQIKSFNSSVIANGELKTLGANVIKLSEQIETGNDTKLVIELDLKSDAGNDMFALRATDAASKYINIISSNGSEGNSTTYAKNFYSSKGFKLTTAGAYTKIRMEIDLETGVFDLYQNGANTKSGTYTDVAAVLNGVTELYIREDSTDTHYIDNLLIYTVTN